MTLFWNIAEKVLFFFNLPIAIICFFIAFIGMIAPKKFDKVLKKLPIPLKEWQFVVIFYLSVIIVVTICSINGMPVF